MQTFLIISLIISNLNLCGFAAETNNLEDYAKKLNEKNCDWIIANDVSNKKIGFNSDFNEVSIYYKNDKIDSSHTKLNLKFLMKLW